MHDIVVRPVAAPDAPSFDGTFMVTHELRIELREGRLTHTSVPVAPYAKAYSDAEGEDESPPDAVLVAYCGGNPVGKIELSRSWNRYARIENLVVDAMSRNRGVGCSLVRQAQQWSEEQALPGIVLETQHNNTAACRLYERCGFRLAGFDADLYRGLDPDTREIALFWYWHRRTG